jgi:hypothetical protein
MENVVPDLTQGLLVSRDSDEHHHHHHHEEEEEEEDINIVTESKIKNRGFSLRNISSSSNGKGRVKIRDFDTAMLFVSASLKGRSHKIRVDNAFSVRCYRWFHSKMWRQIVGFACTVYIIVRDARLRYSLFTYLSLHSYTRIERNVDPGIDLASQIRFVCLSMGWILSHRFDHGCDIRS